MVGANHRFQLSVAVLGGLDQQRMLFVTLDFPAPAVYRLAGGKKIHAGGQAPLDEQQRKRFRTCTVGQIGND